MKLYKKHRKIAPLSNNKIIVLSGTIFLKYIEKGEKNMGGKSNPHGRIGLIRTTEMQEPKSCALPLGYYPIYRVTKSIITFATSQPQQFWQALRPLHKPVRMGRHRWTRAFLPAQSLMLLAMSE